ncbi:MAG: laminin G domain-containing protein [Sedimentisphaerales bacterium]|nr:laminin G domain-containing protein [Sedimentisphaerales bacterium]
MIKNDKNKYGLLFLILCVISTASIADEVAWNAAINASDPLHWYKFDELSGTDCIDYGSGGLNGTYRSLVDLNQEGAFGPGKAVLFERGGQNDLMWTSGGTVETPEWTAEFIVKKNTSTQAQALCDSPDFSLRLVGWNTEERLSFTEYGVWDAEFDPEPGTSLIVPVGKWSHITFRKKAGKTQVFINAILVGTTSLNIDCPIETFGGRRDSDSDAMEGYMDEAVIFDRALSDIELAKHSHAYNPELLPDGFELYENSDSLNSLWTGNGATVLLDTAVSYDGNNSMKAIFDEGGGALIKDTPRDIDLTDKDDQELVVWFKGDPANVEGTVTLKVADPNGIPFASQTAETGTTSADWNWIKLSVNASDPNFPWNVTSQLIIEVSAAGTLNFDNIELSPPYKDPVKVVDWKFDETEGKIAVDSSGNGINGVLDYTFPAIWAIDGGNTGQPGDNALVFGPDPNYIVIAENVVLPEGVENIFSPTSSWTINQWVYLNAVPVSTVMLGGFGRSEFYTGDTDEAGSMRQVYSSGGNIAFWPHYGDIITTEPLDVGKWQMITVTYDKWVQFLYIYKNGKEIGKGAVSLSDAMNRISISPLGLDHNAYFDGMVDDFTIWDGKLPWQDKDDNPTNDILSLWGSWVCLDDVLLPYDYDGNCRVDLADFAILAATWMECGREPATFCE